MFLSLRKTVLNKWYLWITPFIIMLIPVVSYFAFFKAHTQSLKMSDHFDGTHFFNPLTGNAVPHSFRDLLTWQMNSKKERWPNHLPLPYPDKGRPAQTIAPGEVLITWVGHATTLIQIGGTDGTTNILTDPIWSERPSPLSWIGPKRVYDPAIAFEHLPKIDAIVVSHNHYDHMDIPTLKMVAARDNPIIVVGLENEKILHSAGLDHVTPLDWWDSVKLGDIEITFTPSLHWSRRGLWDKGETLWGSFYIKTSSPAFSIYFAGDTSFGPHFKDIYEKLGAPDVALLPIGAYEPRWFMKAAHMNPHDAVMAHQALHARHSIPIHYRTFQLSDEGLETPLKDLQKSLQELKVAPEEFSELPLGLEFKGLHKGF